MNGFETVDDYFVASQTILKPGSEFFTGFNIKYAQLGFCENSINQNILGTQNKSFAMLALYIERVLYNEACFYCLFTLVFVICVSCCRKRSFEQGQTS